MDFTDFIYTNPNDPAEPCATQAVLQGVFMLEVTGDGDLSGQVARLAAAHVAGQPVPARCRS